MRYLIICLALPLLLSCGGPSDTSTSESAGIDTLQMDTISYDYFKDGFSQMTLPIHFDSSYLWDGEPFYNLETDEYDFESNKIPIHLLESWIVEQDKLNSSLSEFIVDFKDILNQERGWYNVYYGGQFSEGSHDYFIVYVYDKPSQVNGAQFYYHLLEYENQELIEVIELGREGVQTYPYSEENDEEYLWWRNTTYYSVEITIESGDDIEVCEYMRFEVEGDLSAELLVDTIKPNVSVDSTGHYLEIYPVKCTEY